MPFCISSLVYAIGWVLLEPYFSEVYLHISHDDLVELLVADRAAVVVQLASKLHRAEVADVHVVALAHAEVLALFAAQETVAHQIVAKVDLLIIRY